VDAKELIKHQLSLRADSEALRQVLFYSASSELFATTWQTAVPDGRWAFRFSMDADVSFISFVLEIMQDSGRPAQHVLIATKGGGAYFYGAPDDAVSSDKTVVGLLPDTRQPSRFANAVATFAPGAPFTLLSDSGAGNTVIGPDTYIGVDMMATIAAVLGQPMLASDEVVVRNADGTATTVGNIYEALADGTCTIKYPAPGGGQAQNFPLTPP
jgi:hypothetical protein